MQYNFFIHYVIVGYIGESFEFFSFVNRNNCCAFRYLVIFTVNCYPVVTKPRYFTFYRFVCYHHEEFVIFRVFPVEQERVFIDVFKSCFCEVLVIYEYFIIVVKF